MRFSPPSEKHKDMPAGNDETRSILQVPSLSSSGVDRSAGEEKKEDDHAPRNMVQPVWRSNNMAYRPGNHMMPRHDAWSTYSPQPPHWINSPAQHDANRAVPPYSPLLVRSTRGAARAAYPIHQRHYQQMQQQAQTPAIHDLSGGQRTGFPVSNRGRGGPGAVHRIVATPIKQATDRAPSIIPTAVEPSKPRPILKRKLPITTRRSTDETASDTEEESCGSVETDSKRSKLDETASSGDSFVKEVAAL